MEPHEKALGKIKIALIGSKQRMKVAYAKVLFSVNVIWSDQLPTAGISVSSLCINPDFFMGLSFREQEGLIAHEALHLLYRHPTDFRTFKRSTYTEAQEHELWNEAADYRINYDLKEAGYTLPSMGLYDEKYDQEWSTLTVYKELHDQIARGERPDPTGYGDFDVIPPKPEDQNKDAAKANKVVISANLAASASDIVGTMPGQLKRVIEEARRPRLDFFTILANYMSGVRHDDYSMRRPNRRYWPDFYLPSLYSESVMDLVFIFDLSGSVNATQAGVFKRSIRITKEQLQPEKITLLTFDTELYEAQVVNDALDVDKLEFTGGGGTDIKPVLDWIVTEQPRVTVVFTDGFFNKPELEKLPSTDIIWIIHDNPEFKWPYGKIIHHRINT